MMFSNDAQRRAVFANIGRFSKKSDQFQTQLGSSDIQTKLTSEKSPSVDQIYMYHDIPMYVMVPERDRLPVDVAQQFVYAYGEGILPHLEDDVDKLINSGFSFDEAVELVEKIRNRKHGFVGDISDIVGKRKGKRLENHLKKAEQFHDVLAEYENSRTSVSIPSITKGKKFKSGVSAFKVAAVEKAIIDTYGVDALDSFDVDAVDWSEDVESIVNKIKSLGVRYYEVHDPDIVSRYSNSAKFYAV